MKRLTSEELARVHAALQAAGTIKGAAGMLSVNDNTVRDYVKMHPELQAYLPNCTPPTEAETIVRTELVPAASLKVKVAAATAEGSAEDQQLAVRRLEKSLQKSLARIGIMGEEADKIVALQAMGATQFPAIRQFMGGSLFETYLNIQKEINAITAKLKAGGFEYDDEESVLREDRRILIQQLIAISDRIDKSVTTSALLEARKNGGDGKKKGKIGFQPLTAQQNKTEIHAHGPVTVVGSDPK